MNAPLIAIRIPGVPYSKNKRRGDIEAPKRWSEMVIECTKELPRVKESCILNVGFALPPNKFPSDLPYGPDLDNLLKRLFDALNETVFSDAPGKDSCVISMSVMKLRVESERDAGVQIEIALAPLIEVPN